MSAFRLWRLLNVWPIQWEKKISEIRVHESKDLCLSFSLIWCVIPLSIDPCGVCFAANMMEETDVRM